ncbi:DEKNAAC104774 [Brettanomyces naardenensis]|uniref:DEKNAAC104774 n=1 Tax=Brettanomyces naardenensis TaxID=13370 RepID=A0A448YRT6_BRENA|nr:DEKNAAC104774 [Brettanomyces naardenensis]
MQKESKSVSSELKEKEEDHVPSDEVNPDLEEHEEVVDGANTDRPEFSLVSTQMRSLNEEIPNKFRGWGLLSALGFCLFCFNTWGSNAAYALYLQEYINEDVFPGSTVIDYGAIGGLTFGSGLVMAPLINYGVGFVGLKVAILCGVLVQFVGVMLASYSTKLWQIYCTQGLMQGIGMALVAVPSYLILPQWFKGGPGGKRNLAFGLGTAGSGVGGIVYNIGMEPILTKHGWHWALRTQAIICLVLNLVAILLSKSRDDKVKPVYKVYDREVFLNFGSLIMTIWVMLSLLGYVVLMYSLGDFTRAMGYGTKEASVVSTMVSVGIVYGRPAVGIIADRIGPIQASIIASWLVALFAFAMWLPCKNYATAIVFALFTGSLMGTVLVTSAAISAAVVGLRKFGVVMSLGWISVGVPGIVSPIIGLSLKSGGAPSRAQYRNPTIFIGCCYVAAGLVLCILRGWFIARNRLAGETERVDMLKVVVPFRDGFLGVFTLGNHKV